MPAYTIPSSRSIPPEPIVGITPIAGATAGSVFFAGVNGVLQTDNAGFFYDDTLNAVGIGVFPTLGQRLQLLVINTGTAQAITFYDALTVNPSGTTSSNQRAAQFALVFAGTQAITSGQAFFLDGQISNTNTLNDMRGFDASITLTGGGAAANVWVAVAGISHQSTGTVADLRLFYTKPIAQGASSTFGQIYGLYLDDMTPAAGTRTNLPYGVYQIDTTIRNYFGAKVGFGETNPLSKVHITGASGWILQDEQDTDPTTTELDSLDAIAVYNKSNKFVIAYNNAGTITFISIPLDGSTTTWTHNTTAP